MVADSLHARPSSPASLGPPHVAGLILVYGLAYSLFPFIVIDRLTIWQAASAPASLLVILIGAAVVLPAILAYTVFAYRVFRGKARELTYG